MAIPRCPIQKMKGHSLGMVINLRNRLNGISQKYVPNAVTNVIIPEEEVPEKELD